jgi:Leucine rich repeat
MKEELSTYDSDDDAKPPAQSSSASSGAQSVAMGELDGTNPPFPATMLTEVVGEAMGECVSEGDDKKPPASNARASSVESNCDQPNIPLTATAFSGEEKKAAARLSSSLESHLYCSEEDTGGSDGMESKLTFEASNATRAAGARHHPFDCVKGDASPASHDCKSSFASTLRSTENLAPSNLPHATLGPSLSSTYPRPSSVRPGAYRINPIRPAWLPPISDTDFSTLPSDGMEMVPVVGSSTGSPESSREGRVLDGELVDAEPAESRRHDDPILVQAVPIDIRQLGASQLRRRALSFLVILTCLVTVALVVVMQRSDSEHGSRSEITFDQFVKAYAPANRSLDGTPQGEALRWLQLDVEDKLALDWRLMQRYSLAVIYFSLRGDHWFNSTNWISSEHECSWHCSSAQIDLQPCDVQGRYTSLALHDNNATGTIPSEIGLLAYLRRIELGENTVSGALPAAIGRLARLEEISLWRNLIGGTIPAEVFLLPKLTYLQISENLLTGTLPKEVANLTNLGVFQLSDNALTGPLPTEVGSAFKLGYFSVAGNSLVGTIPTEIGQLKDLTNFEINSNRFFGTVITELGLLHSLEFVSVGDNALTGPIPPQLGLPRVVSVVLEENKITGTIPPEL